MSYIGSTISQQVTTPAVDYFNGNGVTTTFQLTRTVTSVFAIQVVVNNVPQNPREAYGITSSNQIVFTSAPSAGTNNIYVVYDSQVGQTVTPSPGTVNTAQLGSISNINSVNNDLTVQVNGIEQLRVSPTRPLAVESSTLAAAGSPAVTIRGESNTERMVIFSSGAGGGTPVFSAFASRGTEATPTASQSGDALGFYQFGSHDGTNFNRSAWIQGLATENHAVANRGTAMTFHTTPNGSTALSERMRLTQDGFLLNGNTPAFYITHNATSGTNDPNGTVIILTAPILNRGSRYSTATGRFTCPVAGLYQFFFGTIKSDNGVAPDGRVSRFRIRRNGSNISTELRLSENGGYGESSSIVCIAECSANDFIDVFLTDVGGWYGNTYAHFGGFLIG